LLDTTNEIKSKDIAASASLFEKNKVAEALPSFDTQYGVQNETMLSSEEVAEAAGISALTLQNKRKPSTTKKNKTLGQPKGKQMSKAASVMNRIENEVANTTSTGSPSDDPVIGKLVAFWLGGTIGKQLMVQFGFKLTFDAVCFELNNEAGHLLGTVMRIVKVKKGSLYTVVWEYSSLGETQLPLSAILEGYKEGEVITKKRLGASREKADKPL
jgi:hypothetical protein